MYGTAGGLSTVSQGEIPKASFRQLHTGMLSLSTAVSAAGERPQPPSSCFSNPLEVPQSSRPQHVPYRQGPQRPPFRAQTSLSGSDSIPLYFKGQVRSFQGLLNFFPPRPAQLTQTTLSFSSYSGNTPSTGPSSLPSGTQLRRRRLTHPQPPLTSQGFWRQPTGTDSWLTH